MNRQEKVFLDTSVFSYLVHPDAPEKMRDTQALWQLLLERRYDAYISESVRDELTEHGPEKWNRIKPYFEKLSHHMVISDAETVDLAKKMIAMGILPQNCYADCLRIANAILHECDIFVSWDCKHVVRLQVIRGIRALTLLEGYRNLEICLPSMLIWEEDAEEALEEMSEEPVLSERFDLDDIRKLRAYNSQRYLRMTTQEILADIHEGAARFLRRRDGLKVEEEP